MIQVAYSSWMGAAVFGFEQLGDLRGYSGEGEHAFQRERERDFQSEYEQFSERSDAGSLIVPQPFTFVKEILP